MPIGLEKISIFKNFIGLQRSIGNKKKKGAISKIHKIHKKNKPDHKKIILVIEL